MVNGSGRCFSLEDTQILKGMPVERCVFVGKFRMQKCSCALEKAWNKAGYEIKQVAVAPSHLLPRILPEFGVLHPFCYAQAQS